MLNTSWISGIRRSFRSKRLPPLGRKRANRRRTNAQDVRCLLGGVSEQVDEQQGRALPRRDELEEPPYVFSQLHLTKGIGRLGDGDQLSNSNGRAAPAQPKRIQRDSEEVGRRIVDPVELPPSFPKLQECLLCQLLGVVPVPR